MASKLKKFFKNKKDEAKLKLGIGVGPGHKLGDSSSLAAQQQAGKSHNKPGSSSSAYVPPKGPQTAERQQAAAAALARLEQKSTANKPAFNTSLAAVRAQAKKELEAELAAQQEKEEPVKQESSSSTKDSERLAVAGVYFTCPLIGPEVLSKEEWNIKIREFLYEQLEHERGLTAALMIYTLNKNKDKVEQCVSTLRRMLENIIQNPENEKYRKVKVDSKAYQDKIKDVEGGLELLLAAGFIEQELETSPDLKEKYLIFPEENLCDIEQLTMLCDALDTAEPITLDLDRGLQVLLPSQASRRQQLPTEFYRLTPEEIKREQQLRSEAVERGMMLRTKAMREKEELREMKMYKYAIIRIRFPDGVLLQGTFNVYEKFIHVLNFIRECVSFESRPFTLLAPNGQKLTESEADNNLLELKLVPATILIFSWDSSCAPGEEENYLKPDILILMQQI